VGFGGYVVARKVNPVLNPKKESEARILIAAREAGLPLPMDGVPGEEPDFSFQIEGGMLGLEITELVRPASSNRGIVPVEEEAFHNGILRSAEELYYAVEGAKPVRLLVYFANARGQRKDKREMARSLVDCVRSNIHRANPYSAVDRGSIPQGFNHIGIFSEPGDWWSGECGGITLDEIPKQLAARINAKNELLSTYRANLPKAVQFWLLIYSRPTVARNMPIPYGSEQWAFPFDFDRVFWFDCLQNEVGEIRRAGA